MNKRIHLILLAVFVLIISIINCKADSSAFFSRPASCLSIITAYQNDIPCQFNLKKENNHKSKNAIRIKALDDAAAIVFPSCWVPVINVCYFTKPFYCNYSSPIISLRFSRHKLRGPPVV